MAQKVSMRLRKLKHFERNLNMEPLATKPDNSSVFAN